MLARQLAPLLGDGFLGAAFALHAGGGFLPHARHAAAYLGLRAENIVNRLVDLIRQPALLEIAHGKVVGQLQHHAATLGHIAHIILPGGQRGMLAQQDIVDHMRVAIGVLQKILLQRRACNAQRQPHARKRRAQRLADGGVLALPGHIFGQQIKIRLPRAALIDHAVHLQAALQFRGSLFKRGK